MKKHSLDILLKSAEHYFQLGKKIAQVIDDDSDIEKSPGGLAVNRLTNNTAIELSSAASYLANEDLRKDINLVAAMADKALSINGGFDVAIKAISNLYNEYEDDFEEAENDEDEDSPITSTIHNIDKLLNTLNRELIQGKKANPASSSLDKAIRDFKHEFSSSDMQNFLAQELGKATFDKGELKVEKGKRTTHTINQFRKNWLEFYQEKAKEIAERSGLATTPGERKLLERLEKEYLEMVTLREAIDKARDAAGTFIDPKEIEKYTKIAQALLDQAAKKRERISDLKLGLKRESLNHEFNLIDKEKQEFKDLGNLGYDLFEYKKELQELYASDSVNRKQASVALNKLITWLETYKTKNYEDLSEQSKKTLEDLKSEYEDSKLKIKPKEEFYKDLAKDQSALVKQISPHLTKELRTEKGMDGRANLYDRNDLTLKMCKEWMQRVLTQERSEAKKKFMTDLERQLMSLNAEMYNSMLAGTHEKLSLVEKGKLKYTNNVHQMTEAINKFDKKEFLNQVRVIRSAIKSLYGKGFDAQMPANRKSILDTSNISPAETNPKGLVFDDQRFVELLINLRTSKFLRRPANFIYDLADKGFDEHPGASEEDMQKLYWTIVELEKFNKYYLNLVVKPIDASIRKVNKATGGYGNPYTTLIVSKDGKNELGRLEAVLIALKEIYNRKIDEMESEEE